MKVLTVITKEGAVKEFPLLRADVKIVTSLRAVNELPDRGNFVCVNPDEITLLAVLEYPEATPNEDTTNFEVDSGPTL